MDPERTYLRVHARVSGMLSQLLTPRIRMALEYAYLAVAVALFCLLVVMHTNFVQQPGCSGELSAAEFTEAQLIQIKITGAGLWAQNLAEPESVYFQEGVSSETTKVPEMNGDGITIFSPKFWLNWLGSGSRKSKFIFKSWKNEKEFLEPQMEKAFGSSIGVSAYDSEVKAEAKDVHIEQPLSVREAFKEALFLLCTRLKSPIISFYSRANQFSNDARMLLKRARWSTFLEILKSFQLLRFEHLKTSTVQWLEKRSKAFEPTYLYTVEKGYFLLPEGAKTRHNIRTINVTLSAQNACFGNRWQQLLINTFVGYDTILMNSLINFPRHGYLYNFKTKEFSDLTYGQELSEGPRFGDYFVTKCGVLIMSLFVFFTTTMSVSFTLRETQSRMLKFTVQLEHHARNHLPTFQLIFVHVIESLVFVPIMIGVLFFLFAFYDDQLLAFLVLTLVWLCELFTMISVRTAISMQFFPRFFLLYFLVFHIYFFSYAYGFSYLAFSATAAFMQHLILYFWNRFEVPALQRFMRARAQLQHQAGVQITAPTMYTPTLHVAGAAMPELGVRNPHLVNNVFASGPEAPPRANPATGSDRTVRYQGPEPSEVPDSNSQQAATATVSSSLNTFGSLLFWILGGVSSDGLFSFFSMFRDIRDHGQVHADQPRQGNERPT